MKKLKIFAPTLGFVFAFALSSCSSAKDWNKAGTSLNVNYVLLQGQVDHNDSIARTLGVRTALDTCAEPDAPNQNVASTKTGTLKKGDLAITVNEVEHAEMRSTAGATWDSIAANDTTTIWLNKHGADSWSDSEGNKKKGQSISLFVSNNDGMTFGATGSVMWPKGMPIFGYDGNENALLNIRDGKMTGTIDNGPISQAIGTLLTVRNAVEASATWNGSNWVFDSNKLQDVTIGGKTQKRVPFETAFKYTNAYTEAGGESEEEGNHGVMQIGNLKANNNDLTLLSQNIQIYKYTDFYSEVQMQNLNKFFDSKMESVTPVLSSERHNGFEPQIHENSTGGEEHKISIFQTFNSATDTFFSSTMKPLFNKYAKWFNIEATQYDGNGNDEQGCLDAFETALKKDGYNAFIINMVKSSSTGDYLDRLKASNYYNNGKFTVPVIFWNKQPTDTNGKADIEVLQDDAFIFTCYSGIDNSQGAAAQGEMIKDYILNQYEGEDE